MRQKTITVQNSRYHSLFSAARVAGGSSNTLPKSCQLDAKPPAKIMPGSSRLPAGFRSRLSCGWWLSPICSSGLSRLGCDCFPRLGHRRLSHFRYGRLSCFSHGGLSRFRQSGLLRLDRDFNRNRRFQLGRFPGAMVPGVQRLDEGGLVLRPQRCVFKASALVREIFRNRLRCHGRSVPELSSSKLSNCDHSSIISGPLRNQTRAVRPRDNSKSICRKSLTEHWGFTL